MRGRGVLDKLKHRFRKGMLRDIVSETAWIYRHTRAYRKAIALYLLLGLASTLLGIVLALLSKELINTIVSAASGRRIFALGATVVSVSTVNILLSALTSRFSAKVNLRIANEMRAEVFGVLLDTQWQALQPFHSGDLLSRIQNDASTVAASVLGWLPTLIIKATQFLASLVVILINDPTMALFALLSAPLTLLVAKPYVKKMRAMSRETREAGSRLVSFHEEALQNVQSIKAFQLSDAFRARLDRVQAEYYDVSVAFNRFSVLNSAFLSFCSMLAGYLCLGWGAYRLWLGKIDFGTMVLFIQLASYLSAAMTALIKLVPSAVECTTAAGRVMAVLSLPREDLRDTQAAQALRPAALSLHLSGLCFSYRKDAPVLKDVSLSVAAGETIALVGASGSGKTTLFRLLLGLLTPTGGTAEVTDGTRRLALSPATRCLFSYVPQDNVIFSGTVEDMLRLVRPQATQEELLAALRVACAEEFVLALPQGLQTPLSERGGTLSVGQNQRLAIARAVLADAPILLFDEITSALDRQTEERVLKNLAALPNKTCILATHRPSALSLCDRVCRLHDNHLEEE